MIQTQNSLFQAIEDTIEKLNIETVSSERKAVLEPLINYIQDKVSNNEPIRINFICTHNSRRSHLSQIWAQTLAKYYNINTVECYSGGTEATALFPMVAKILKKSGFEIETLSNSQNPIYAIRYSDNDHPIIGFSKTLDDSFNPKSHFAAVMTCSQADEGCPFVSGAEKRIPITFDDPKAFDGTPEQQAKYLERSLQIATELKYVFSQIKK